MSLTQPPELEVGKVLNAGGLTVDVNSFHYSLNNVHIDFPGTLGFLLPDNTINFVYVDTNTNTIASSTGLPNDNFLFLAKVTTSGGDIINIQDERAFLTSDSRDFFELNKGLSGFSTSLNWKDATNQFLSLNNNCTLSFTAPIGPSGLQLRTQQDVTGGRILTWPASVVFPIAGISISTASKVVTIYELYFAGSSYYMKTAASYNV